MRPVFVDLVRRNSQLRGASMPRWAWLTPLIAVSVFVAVMVAIFVYLRGHEAAQQRETLNKDLEYTQQSVRLRLTALQESLLALSRDVATGDVSDETVWSDTAPIINDYPFVVAMAWLDTEGGSRWVRPAPNVVAEVVDIAARRAADEQTRATWRAVRDTGLPAYSRPFLGGDKQIYIELQVPVGQARKPQGTLLALLSLDRMMTTLVPAAVSQKYRVFFVDSDENVLASTSARAPQDSDLTYATPLDPPGRGLAVRAYAYATDSQLVGNMLLALVFGLSALIIWSLSQLYRHTRRRNAAERALLAETTFRRAMEDSLITGMRALDLHGRITYVNKAFCDMLGMSEAELIGKTAPFPYWVEENSQEHHRSLALVLSGNAPPSGFQIEVQRADGTRFPARMYVSPLIDENGVQTGWMTSMTDITEPNKIRDELAAAQRRFVTVFEQLDAAVSVRAVSADGEDELLFANAAYERLFGRDIHGHLSLSADDLEPEVPTYETYQPRVQRWFEVRERQIDWVDGRTARLQVATDVTLRHEAEEQSRSQQEKVQLTSRLITMGEMASSLAHELNQPLTAIANYSTGAVSRVKSGNTDATTLLPALEKASEQALRAGAIIRRIREFVKRSEPVKHEVDLPSLADDAVGFAEIEAKRRSVQIVAQIPEGGAPVMADRIMIEQVLLNLLKNAIEAMKDCALPPAERIVRLEVEDRGYEVEFSVIDRGHGVPDAIKDKLFDPFFSTKSDGMGMGLNICRTIIEFHQGRLWVDDNPAGGAAFHFTLPRASAAQRVERSASPTESGMTARQNNEVPTQSLPPETR
jgi:PAS domain S-box-containing protein